MLEILVYGFWVCFLSYVVGVVVGEHKSEKEWRNKYWELHDEYMKEFPESFSDEEEVNEVKD